MYTVELMKQARALAERLGYQVRHEWLEGLSGGACEVDGQKWIFIDLGSSLTDQLDQIVEVLRADRDVYGLTLSPAMLRLLGVRKAA